MNEQCYYRLSVKGLVTDDDGRYLLARESDSRWDMLGGGLDHGEDARKCLAREFLEEVGLEVTDVSDYPKYFLTFTKSGSDSYLANIIYEVTVKNLDFTPSEECQEIRFFSVDDMKQVDLFPNVQKLLEILDAH